jgi:hypothetical protein
MDYLGSEPKGSSTYQLVSAKAKKMTFYLPFLSNCRATLKYPISMIVLPMESHVKQLAALFK